MINKFKIRRFLDAPCGDYNWFRHVPRTEETNYIGGDIVEDLIIKNKEKYENQNTSFISLDITKDDLPKSDIWMCRDVLFHFSNEHIFLALENFLKSQIPYLLTSSHTECEENADILTGYFRLLNLELPPFNLPKPILYIDDYIEGFPVRKMCLWDRKAIQNTLRGKI